MNAPLNVLHNPEAASDGSKLKLDPRAYARGLGCVHCGLCLPACPTYTETGNESDSPRGRIQLMLGLADGKIDATDTVKKHLDLCLDCRGCETACPSGVVYHELIEETRARFAEQERPTFQGRVMRWIFFHIFVYPTRLKLALFPARVMQKLGLYSVLRRIGVFKFLPPQMRKMEQMLPAKGPLWPRKLPPHVRAGGMEAIYEAILHKKQENVPEPPKIGFFAGCIGAVMFEAVNKKAVMLLAAAGADVYIPEDQVCCGAIHHHNGAHGPAIEFAKKNIDTYLPKKGIKADYIVTNIAGCGAMLREYDVLLRDDPEYVERAREFVKRVRDVCEVLHHIGMPETRHKVNFTVTYHDACHLAHAQKVTSQPRELLAKVRGLKLIPLPESDTCCGAAGTYNLTQPEMATQLAERKLRNIATTGARTCATGNVGCAMQIQSEADARGINLRVVHPVEILHEAVFGPESVTQTLQPRPEDQ